MRVRSAGGMVRRDVVTLAGMLNPGIGLRVAMLAAALLVAWPSASVAGPIERACLRSDRPAANRAVCDCIDRVADQILRTGDQRRAAKFFRDPDLAHRTWMSKQGADDVFWDRYKAFGAQAQATCTGR